MQETYSEAAMQAEVAQLVNENNDDVLDNRIEELAGWKKEATGEPVTQCRKAVKALLRKMKDGLKADLKAKQEPPRRQRLKTSPGASSSIPATTSRRRGPTAT